MSQQEKLSQFNVNTFLNPIKDLAKNWNIDIASELEDYMNELENLTIKVGEEKLNFTEAALIIKGSATIYAKKVSYLHQLVFEALTHINDSKYKII